VEQAGEVGQMKTLYKTADRNFETIYYLDSGLGRTIIGKMRRAKGGKSWWRYEIVVKPDRVLCYFERHDKDYGFSNGIVCRRSPPTLPRELTDVIESLKNGKTMVFDELERWVCDRDP
jgi:hypothetical protein